MDTPFIVVDSRTGFHVASSHLRLLSAEERSKSALAVLCNTIFLQWACIDDNTTDIVSRSSSSSFTVETPLSSDMHGDVQYFHFKNSFLCVVFAKRRHELYERYAECIVEEAVCGRASKLSAAAHIQRCAESVFKDSIRALFGGAGVKDYAIVTQGPYGCLNLGGGFLSERCGVLNALVRRTFTSGVHVAGNLMYSVIIRGETVYAVAAWGVSVECLEVFGDDVLCSWALTLCSVTAH